MYLNAVMNRKVMKEAILMFSMTCELLYTDLDLFFQNAL